VPLPLPPPTQQPEAAKTPHQFTVAADMGHFDKDGNHVPAPSAGTMAQDVLRHLVLWALQGQQELEANLTQLVVLHCHEQTAGFWVDAGSPIVSKGSAVIKSARVLTLPLTAPTLVEEGGQV